MPNQRDSEKKRIAVWLTPKQRKALQVLIDEGVVKDMSDFVKKAIQNEAKMRGISNEDHND